MRIFQPSTANKKLSNFRQAPCSASSVKIKQETKAKLDLSNQNDIPSSKKFHACLIGGKESKFTINLSYPLNVMSKGQFRNLRSEKFKFFTGNQITIKIDDLSKYFIKYEG